jgi:asparagine synthetase B (glutamine-hydrolysing)
LLDGLGADEQLAGYGRHRSCFRAGGWAALRGELAVDVDRLWKRNLGRDDRVLSDHSREARFPYLDENFMALVRALPLPGLADLRLAQGVGDKRILRIAARMLGLPTSSKLVKRAIHFGSRIAKQSNVILFGSNRAAKGDAIFKFDDLVASDD